MTNKNGQSQQKENQEGEQATSVEDKDKQLKVLYEKIVQLTGTENSLEQNIEEVKKLKQLAQKLI